MYTKVFKAAKLLHNSKLIENSSNKLKMTLKIINDSLGKSKANIINQLDIDGNEIYNPDQIL